MTGLVDVVTGIGIGLVIGVSIDVVIGVVVGGNGDGDNGEHRAILLES